MQGWKTIIVAAIMFAAPALARWGFHVDAEIVADAMIVIAGPMMAMMRAVTRSPIGQKE